MSTKPLQEEAPIHSLPSWGGAEGRLASGILAASHKNLLISLPTRQEKRGPDFLSWLDWSPSRQPGLITPMTGKNKQNSTDGRRKQHV